MKSAGKCARELALVLERIVPLRERHRARVEPGVDHLAARGASCRRPRARGHVYASMNGLCGSKSAGSALPRSRRELGVAARSPRRAADPRRTPTPGAACPSSGRARAPSRRCSPATRRSARCPTSGGCQSIARVEREHPVLDRRRADEPRLARVVEQRRVAAPAVRIGVLDRARFPEHAAPFSSSMIAGVGVLHEHARRPRAGPPGIRPRVVHRAAAAPARAACPPRSRPRRTPAPCAPPRCRPPPTRRSRRR